MTLPENAQPAPLGEEGGLQKQDQIGKPASTTHETDSLRPRVHHPLAKLFPRMSEAEFGELCASIGSNGQRDDITTLNGQVLDGVNREAACFAVGIAPRYAELPAGIDPLLYVIDKNRVRRHLDDDQRRMVAAKIATLGRGRRDSNLSNGEISRAEAAALMTVDIQGVDRAKVVLKKGIDELQQAVEERKVTVRSAADIATLSKEDQREILAEIASNPDGKRVLKQVAKQVRAADQRTNHEERQHKLENIAARNPELPTGRLHSLVLIDVPRHHHAYAADTGSEKAPENHFPTIPFNELCDFPIDRFAAPDAVLLYWSTAASLLDDLDIIAEWGFIPLRRRDENGKLLRGEDGRPLPSVGCGKYGSHQIWRKRRVGKQTGTGRWFMDQHEILIAARRGNVPAPLPGTQDESVFDAPVGAHSEKPHEHVRAWIDRCWPHLTKVEVFARGTAPPGWMFWGNQADPFRDGRAELVGVEAAAAAPTTWVEAAAAAVADEVEIDHQDAEQEAVEEVDEPQGAPKPPKLATHESDLGSAVSGAFEEIAELATECRDIVENAPDGLRETERIQTLEATADCLESLETPHFESDEIAGIAVTYTEVLPKRKDRGLSRASRMSNAVSTIEACIEALEAVAEGDQRHDAARALLDDLNNAVSEAEGCEFPGMVG